MQINERDRSILEHMIRYCDEIEEYVARFGDSKEAFDNDNAYRAACSLNILQIGELSSNLTDNCELLGYSIAEQFTVKILIDYITGRKRNLHDYQKSSIRRFGINT